MVGIIARTVRLGRRPMRWPVVQLAERRTLAPDVAGSSPAGPAVTPAPAGRAPPHCPHSTPDNRLEPHATGQQEEVTCRGRPGDAVARHRHLQGTGSTAGHPQHLRVRQRRDPREVLRVDPRGRRVHRADPHALRGEVDQRRGHRTAHLGRRRQAGVGEADHRSHPVLRLQPPGPQGLGTRADNRPSAVRPLQCGRRRQARFGRPALRSDPGILRRPPSIT